MLNSTSLILKGKEPLQRKYELMVFYGYFNVLILYDLIKVLEYQTSLVATVVLQDPESQVKYSTVQCSIVQYSIVQEKMEEEDRKENLSLYRIYYTLII